MRDEDWSEALRVRIRAAGFDVDSGTLQWKTLAGSPVDLVVYLRSAASYDEARATEVVERIRELPFVSTVTPRHRSLGVRVSEEAVLDSARSALSRTPRDILAGQRWCVEYLDSNLCKPLHLGHLRNVAIGDALAALARVAGAKVVRTAILCDIGRNICEAAAGVRRAPEGAWENTKPDHFVGACYTAFTAGLPQSVDEGDPHAPIGRETSTLGDEADELLRAWIAGEDAMRELWERVRSWSLDGQMATLARLGIDLDEILQQSDFVEDAARVAADGLARGTLFRMPDGRIVHNADKEHVRGLVLVRQDGFPTEYGRMIGVLRALQERAGVTDRYVAVFGDEWMAPSELFQEVLERLYDCPLYRGFARVTHGLVYHDHVKMKSSTGKVVLIDDLIDVLVESEAVKKLASSSRGTVDAASIAAIVIKAFFLRPRASKPIQFTERALLDPALSAGWVLADAWCRCAADLRAPEERALEGSPELRAAALAHREQARHLSWALESLSVHDLARRAVEQAEKIVTKPYSGAAGAVERSTFAELLQGLGLVRLQHDLR